MSISPRKPIRLLDDRTINQIAAGEVIENTSSVVKELLDNAIDAGASALSVETQWGGRGLIKVSDNGCGMGKDDLMLCLERHATSKIYELNDLNMVGSLGFRGEALPSIAAVSKMTLHSSSEDNPGHQITVEGGKIQGSHSLPRNLGTTVEVRSLFFNVPVRKKFQKSPASDTAEIHKILTRAALCYPSISLSWIHDDKIQFAFTDQDNLESRIKVLLGEEFTNHILPIELSENGQSITGFLSSPSCHRPNRTGQYLFLNRRAITSSFISARILEGYATRLPTHRYPLFVLHIQIPPDWIDVNVHPQKKEVRLRNEEPIASFLINSVEKGLKHESSFLPDDRLFSSFKTFEISTVETLRASEKPVSYFTENEPLLFKPHCRVLKVFGSFLLAEDSEGLFIIHVQAAYCRIIFEKQKSEPKIGIQQLLIPINIEFSGAEKRALLEKIDKINELGISIRYFGGNTFVVDAIPQFFDREEIPNLLHKLLEGDPILQLSLSARKRVSSADEGERLIEQLFQCNLPHETPDGRPTYFRLTEEEISKKFKK